MQPPLLYKIKDQNFWLSATRSLFWEEQKALILSDLHLGKTGHFRKAGIAVPQNVLKNDMQRFIEVVQHFQPEKLIIVGDLFHSDANKELELFSKWRNDLKDVQFYLVKGNHDILQKKWYADTCIHVTEQLHINSFVFCHDVACLSNNAQPFIVPKKNASMKNMQSHQLAYNVFRNTGYYTSETTTLKLKEEFKEKYVFSGHFHPGVVLNGSGKQSLRFPCFYFFKTHCILPAFGKFTGLAIIEPRRQDAVFAIVENNVIRLK
ncbi:MAG: ligase-associated DNA damage response endonuclease PdeM [Chitinophagaceae bacterium]